MNRAAHLASHQIKLSDEWGDWGHKTLCGQKVEWAPVKPSERTECPKCLRIYMMKKESEIRQCQKQIDQLLNH